MLARRIPSILPPQTLEESLAVTKIYSVGGLLGSHTALVTRRPSRPLHYLNSSAASSGGSRPRQKSIVSVETMVSLLWVRRQRLVCASTVV